MLALCVLCVCHQTTTRQPVLKGNEYGSHFVHRIYYIWSFSSPCARRTHCALMLFRKIRYRFCGFKSSCSVFSCHCQTSKILTDEIWYGRQENVTYHTYLFIHRSCTSVYTDTCANAIARRFPLPLPFQYVAVLLVHWFVLPLNIWANSL